MGQLGKRYRCETCGTEVLCTKASPPVPACCSKELVNLEPKAIPSSD